MFKVEFVQKLNLNKKSIKKFNEVISKQLTKYLFMMFLMSNI